MGFVVFLSLLMLFNLLKFLELEAIIKEIRPGRTFIVNKFKILICWGTAQHSSVPHMAAPGIMRDENNLIKAAAAALFYTFYLKKEKF